MARFEQRQFLRGYQDHRAPTPVQLLGTADVSKRIDLSSSEWIRLKDIFFNTREHPTDGAPTNPLGEIALQDHQASTITEYKLEDSSLVELNESFPNLDKKKFEDLVCELAQRGRGRIFEYGGGSSQTAARDLLKTIPGVLRYTGYEARPLLEDVKPELDSFPQYRFVQGGLEKFDPEKFGKGSVDVAFAHRVAPLLPHPFLMVEKLHDLIAPKGLLSVNNIPLDKRVADTLTNQWKEHGYQFAYRYDDIPELWRIGATMLSFTLRKTEDALIVPEITQKKLKDRSGKAFAVFEYQLPRPQ